MNPETPIEQQIEECASQWALMTDENYKRAMKRFRNCVALDDAICLQRKKLYAVSLMDMMLRSYHKFLLKTNLPDYKLSPIKDELLDMVTTCFLNAKGLSEEAADHHRKFDPMTNWTLFAHCLLVVLAALGALGIFLSIYLIYRKIRDKKKQPKSRQYTPTMMCSTDASLYAGFIEDEFKEYFTNKEKPSIISTTAFGSSPIHSTTYSLYRQAISPTSEYSTYEDSS